MSAINFFAQIWLQTFFIQVISLLPLDHLF